jgi:uncharacterized protein YutE (UPF0331/DUF86 family)
MNLDDIRGKLDVLDANTHQLQWLRAISREEFAGDPRNLDSALHRLQTSIQALIDIAAYVVGSLGIPTPQHSADLIDALGGAGLISAEKSGNYRKMIQFRNRVVHLYNRIDPSMVRQILEQHLVDLDGLRDALLAIIATHPDPPGT